jgi:hypothetical protein
VNCTALVLQLLVVMDQGENDVPSGTFSSPSVSPPNTTARKRKRLTLKSVYNFLLYRMARHAPESLTIISGLVVGISSLAYVMILLSLIMYIYSVAGILFFQRNDPWHFRYENISL